MILNSCLDSIPVTNGGIAPSQYASARQSCTAACNSAGYCCTKDSGGCQHAPCTLGCHVAYFSSTVEECKSKCATINGGSCFVEIDRYEDSNPQDKLDLNPFNDNSEILLCGGSDSCGCPSNDWGTANDCSDTACEAACNMMENNTNFYNGSTVKFDNTLDANSTTLGTQLDALNSHISGTNTLSAAEISNSVNLIISNQYALQKSINCFDKAFSLVKLYDDTYGPIFMNPATSYSITRSMANDGKNIDRAIIQVMQSIMRVIYRNGVVNACSSQLQGKIWNTCKYFPGCSLVPNPIPNNSFDVRINCTLKKFWGFKVNFADEAKREPTGIYIPPGCLATVTVPSALVNKGYMIEVGTIEVDREVKGHVKDTQMRLDSVKSVFEVISEQTMVINPLGGNVYINVPYLAEDGLQDINVSGCAIKGTYFYFDNNSADDSKNTTEQEWQSMSAADVPWADLNTETFMMNVPMNSIKNKSFTEIKNLMINYSKAMQGVNEISGFTGDGYYRDKQTLYIQPDRQIKEVAYGVGYPQVNTIVHANDQGPTLADAWMVSDALESYIMFHELGHSTYQSGYYCCRQFPGETEAIVNFPMVYVLVKHFNYSIDDATKESLGHAPRIPDQAVTDWLVTSNFRNGKLMDKSNTEMDEMRYQIRGYVKYIDIGRILDWSVIITYFRRYHVAINNDNVDELPQWTNVNLSDSDKMVLNLSIHAGVDITPLIDFYGVELNKNNLFDEIKSAGIKCSKQIMDQLKNYKDLVPIDNAAFKSIANEYYPGKTIADIGSNGCPSANYGCGWWMTNEPDWNESVAQQTVKALQNIIEYYELLYSDNNMECLDINLITNCMVYTDNSTFTQRECMQCYPGTECDLNGNDMKNPEQDNTPSDVDSNAILYSIIVILNLM